MNTDGKLKEAINSLWHETLDALPAVLFGILILIVGWLIALLISKIIFSLLKRSKSLGVGKLLSMNDLSDKINFNVSFPALVSKVVFWFIFLFFLVAASETLGWTTVSKEISGFVGYLPKIFTSLIIFALGYTLVKLLRDIIKGVTKSTGIALGNFMAEFVFYFLLIVVSLTALAQAGVNISIISTHLYIILGGAVAALAIALGLGSRQVVSDLLKNYYNKSVVNVGDKISYKELSGTVLSISKTSIVIEHQQGKSVIPSKELYENSFTIITDQ